ncbi:MAG TPA: hypothetical protein DEV81_21815 [Cyanobacteria bacterium UBA11049]|nr:hypothetical protein [Cyanobacteria bacterium UBA11049]
MPTLPSTSGRNCGIRLSAGIALYKIIYCSRLDARIAMHYFATSNTLKFIAQNIGFIKLAHIYAEVIVLVADNS